jgi:diguanylate cyclase (GGDEF)-like protein/PAS domain S-box-containing protein/putative nucleotidyltransferase with HDIG domain
MKLLSVKTRVAFGMVCLTVCVIMTAMTLGMIPDRYVMSVQERVALCKTLALHASALISRGSREGAVELLQLLVAGRRDVLSAGIRQKDGRLWVDVGGHARGWNLQPTKNSTDTQIKVPFVGARHQKGQLEVRFAPLRPSGWLSWLRLPTVRMVMFISASCFLAYVFFLSRVLRALDPSTAVPNRVRSALNVLAEGLVVLDHSERIMLANRAFAEIVGVSSEDLQGRRVSTLPWEERASPAESYPWTYALREGNPQTGSILRLKTRENDYRTFVVNAAPVRNPANAIMGVVVCLEDVTPLERERDELNKTLTQLECSREEIRRQNEELRILATLDPLTGCLNRRSFFEQFEVHWKTSQRYDFPVSCVMIDIDHFKAINDKLGHAKGDDVLKSVATAMRKTMRDCDAICRYGGEEFCVLLPHVDVENAFLAAERFRNAVMDLEFEGFQVTASLGVSASTLGADDPQELLQQADKSLYLAKHNGRNQSVRWDQADRYPAIDESQITHTPLPEEIGAGAAIPFHAVSALLSTLTYRDSSTAEHSIRVADLCVLMASGKMPATEVYVLETAALLHDIGKVGVPDAILLKPGPLTEEEWKVINAHERIGVEIIRAAFAQPELVETVMHHHAWYDGNPSRPDLIKGKDCSLRARILTIADAYDTMISDRVYRKARTREEAFEELRRCAGTQFDPVLVEEFIEKVIERNEREVKPGEQISYETAVSIGQTIESLAYALDKRHGPSLALLAGRLKLTAAKRDLPRISDAAERLESAAARNADLVELVQITQELLDLCRTVQRAYIKPLICTSKSEGVPSEARAQE